MGYKLKCNTCGHERLITEEWLNGLKIKFLPTYLSLTIENISKFMPRFQCSKCKSKEARIYPKEISEKKGTNLSKNPKKLKRSGGHIGKIIPDFSINNPFSAHMKGSLAGRYWNPPSADKSQSTASKSPWKKTCYFCNGTGANGNCFHCGGTGWQ